MLTRPPLTAPQARIRYRRPESVLVLVHTPALEVLVLNRVEPAGFWQSVTGSLEWGEQPVEAARRELFEETGLVVPVRDADAWEDFEIRGPWRARYAPHITHNREYRFTACVPGPCEVRLCRDEHIDSGWLPASEALERVWSHTNKAAIRALIEHECG